VSYIQISGLRRCKSEEIADLDGIQCYYKADYIAGQGREVIDCHEKGTRDLLEHVKAVCDEGERANGITWWVD
jgi:hypothetical protein